MADKDANNFFVSVADAAIISQALGTLEASLRRRVNAEKNAGIKQIVADQLHQVNVLQGRFKS